MHEAFEANATATFNTIIHIQANSKDVNLLHYGYKIRAINEYISANISAMRNCTHLASLCYRANALVWTTFGTSAYNESTLAEFPLTFPIWSKLGQNWYMPTHLYDVTMKDGSATILDRVGLIQLVYVIGRVDDINW